MWRRNAPPRLMLPDPRTRKRFAAPFFVFILGICPPSLSFRMTPGGTLRVRLKPRLSLVVPPSELGGLCCNLGRCRLRLLGRFGLGGLRHRAGALFLRRQHHHHLPALELGE